MTLHKHGVNALVYVGGTLLSAANSWRISVASETAEARVFGGTWVSRDKGLMSASGNITGYSEADAQVTQTAALAATPSAVLLYPDDNEATDYYSFSAFFGMQSQAGVQARTTVDGDFVVDGAVAVAGFKLMADKPGYYKSPLEEYPGHIAFPNPLTLNEFKQWWAKAVDPVKLKTALDFETYAWEWEGAALLLVEFGEWAIKGVPVGHVKDGTVPLHVVSWVVDCQDDYIYPQLSEKKRRRLSTIS